MNNNKPNKPPQKEEPQDKINNRIFGIICLGINIPWLAFTIWLGSIFPVLWDNDGEWFLMIGMAGLIFMIPAILLAERHQKVRQS